MTPRRSLLVALILGTVYQQLVRITFSHLPVNPSRSHLYFNSDHCVRPYHPFLQPQGR